PKRVKLLFYPSDGFWTGVLPDQLMVLREGATGLIGAANEARPATVRVGDQTCLAMYEHPTSWHDTHLQAVARKQLVKASVTLRPREERLGWIDIAPNTQEPLFHDLAGHRCDLKIARVKF